MKYLLTIMYFTLLLNNLFAQDHSSDVDSGYGQWSQWIPLQGLSFVEIQLSQYNNNTDMHLFMFHVRFRNKSNSFTSFFYDIKVANDSSGWGRFFRLKPKETSGSELVLLKSNIIDKLTFYGENRRKDMEHVAYENELDHRDDITHWNDVRELPNCPGVKYQLRHSIKPLYTLGYSWYIKLWNGLSVPLEIVCKFQSTDKFEEDTFWLEPDEKLVGMLLGWTSTDVLTINGSGITQDDKIPLNEIKDINKLYISEENSVVNTVIDNTQIEDPRQKLRELNSQLAKDISSFQNSDNSKLHDYLIQLIDKVNKLKSDDPTFMREKQATINKIQSKLNNLKY